MSVTRVSPLNEFFSKEIKNVDYGVCKVDKENKICKHIKITVTYIDGSVKYFRASGYSMKAMCDEIKKPIPFHFSYMQK